MTENVYEVIKQDKKDNRKSMVNRLRPYMETEQLIDYRSLIQFVKDFNFDLQMYLIERK